MQRERAKEEEEEDDEVVVEREEKQGRGEQTCGAKERSDGSGPRQVTGAKVGLHPIICCGVEVAAVQGLAHAAGDGRVGGCRPLPLARLLCRRPLLRLVRLRPLPLALALAHPPSDLLCWVGARWDPDCWPPAYLPD